MRNLFIIPITCLFVACNGGTEVPEQSVVSSGDETHQTPSQRVPDNIAIMSARDLMGEYRVAGVDGASLDLPYGLAVSISRQQIGLDLPCGGSSWNYILRDGFLETERDSEPDPDCLTRSDIHPAVFDAEAAIDSATYVERTPANGVRLSGGGRSITLFSQ